MPLNVRPHFFDRHGATQGSLNHRAMPCRNLLPAMNGRRFEASHPGDGGRPAKSLDGVKSLDSVLMHFKLQLHNFFGPLANLQEVKTFKPLVFVCLFGCFTASADQFSFSLDDMANTLENLVFDQLNPETGNPVFMACDSRHRVDGPTDFDVAIAEMAGVEVVHLCGPPTLFCGGFLAAVLGEQNPLPWQRHTLSEPPIADYVLPDTKLFCEVCDATGSCNGVV